jgi:hypothetical protein
MITLGEFCGLPKRQLATCFGFKTRKSGLDHGIGHLASMSPQKNE